MTMFNFKLVDEFLVDAFGTGVVQIAAGVCTVLFSEFTRISSAHWPKQYFSGEMELFRSRFDVALGTTDIFLIIALLIIPNPTSDESFF